MMNFSEVQGALVDWVEGSTGLTTVWFNMPRPNPARPFATLQMLSMRNVGVDEVRYGEVQAAEQAAGFTVIIDSVGAPDTFKWQKGLGAFTTGVAITGAAQTLSNGITITFEATTGHTLTDKTFILAEGITIETVFTGSGLDDGLGGGTFAPATVTQYLPSTHGFRQLTVRMRVVSRDQRPGYDGMYYVELARTSLKRPFTQGGYQTAGLSFVEAIPISINDAVFDDRMESIAVLDVTFNVRNVLSVGTDITSFIKKTEATIILDEEEIVTDQIFGDLS